MKKNKQLTYLVGLLTLFILTSLLFLKYFNLSWVETTEADATITINFLFPMKQDGFEQYLKIDHSLEDCSDFGYSFKWLNSHVVEIKLIEKNSIKGQKVKLMIDNAPTLINNLKKSGTIPVQFKTNVEIVSPNSELLISSNHAFIVQFNTPMDTSQMNKYLQCNATFYIKPYESTLESGEKYIDPTKFLFIPKEPLENNKQYVLLFKAGMRSQGGNLLKNDQAIILKVDTKPTILKTYPGDGDKWIGLYPCFTLESKEPIIGATAKINNKELTATSIDDYHIYFLLDELLEPETNYQISFQTQVASGELSDIKIINFSTTTLNENRFWLDIKCGNMQQIRCYQGTKRIKTIPFELSSKKFLPRFGTYYLESKNEVYENNQLQIGANYWMMINNKFGIHGQVRNAYWEILNNSSVQGENITISDEDASWLYNQIDNQTMIIVRK